MTSDLSEKVKEIGFWREVMHQVRLLFYLLRDPEVPFYLKLLPFLGFIYLLAPIDLIPDVFIGLGQLDDLTVLLVGSKIFIELVPPHIVTRHRQAIYANNDAADAQDIKEAIVIDGEHERIEDINKQAQR